MSDEIIRKNAIITGVCLIIICIFSFVFSSYYNRRSLEEQLISVSHIASEQMMDTNTEAELYNVVDSFTKNQDWLQITICNSLGNIIKDSENDAIGVSISSSIDEKELKKADTNLQDKERVYISGNRIYYIDKLSSDIILRSSIEYTNNISLILMNLFVTMLLLILVLLLSVLSSRRTTKNIVEVLEDIGTHLKTINDGEYNEVEDRHKYVEVQNVLKEINEVNANIVDSIFKIKHEHSKINFIIDNMEQGIIIISEKEEILLMNDYAKNVLNIDMIIEEGINYHRVIENKDLLKNINKSISKQENESFDLNNNGLVFFTSISYLKNKWYNSQEEIGLYIVLLSNVTEQRANDELKAEFISNASHELKTPITSIRGFSELLIATSDNVDDKTKKYLNIIYNESSKMKSTIDELLYLSNLEYRRNLEGEKEKVYFKDAIELTVEALTEQADRDYISIITHVDENVYIYEQAKLLDHLLNNLVSNAIKYNKTNGKVYINVEETDKSIILTVADTGIGIDEKNIDRIFERFYRVDESRNRRTGGTGVGLNIVKQICNLIEAKISVESKKDVGTKFIIEFNKPEE